MSRTTQTKVAVAAGVAGIALVASACGSSGTPAASPTTSTSASNATAVEAKLISGGLTALKEGNTTAAQSDFAAAFTIVPTSYIAAFDLGVADADLGKTAAAKAAYEKSLAIDPTYRSALFNLGVLLTPTDPSEAIATYERLEKSDPNDPDVEFNLGLLLEDHGQRPAGEVQLGDALKIQPSLKTRIPKGITVPPGA